MKNAAILISGRGTNLQSVIDSNRNGELGINIKLVLSNNTEAKGLEKASSNGIQTNVISHKEFENREAFDLSVNNCLKENGIELVILAGFMRLFTSKFIQNWKGKIINIHPSLLPAFPGLNTHRQAIEYGVKFSGCSVFFVDEGVDTGAIINQAVVPVYPEDSEDDLAKRVLFEEHKILPQAIEWVANGKVKLENGKAVFTKNLN